MMPSTRPLSLVAALVFLAGATASLRADGGTSPFLPPAAAAAATAPAKDATLELRGIMSVGDEQMFSIYDATRKTSAWTRLNETGRDYIVRSYDTAKDTVTIDYQGRTLTLALHTAKVAAAPTSPSGPPGAGPAAPNLPPIGGPVVLNPTPADEQRRLEAIAAEVNRRRLLRQQAIQANRAAGGQVTPQSPQSGQPPGQPPARR